jgi:hypothetical protein
MNGLKMFKNLTGKVPYKLLFILVLITEAVTAFTFILVFLTPDRLFVITQYFLTLVSTQLAIAQFILGVLLTYFYMKWQKQKTPSEVK